MWTCSTSPPSGNLVDGLPLVAHNATGGEGRPVGAKLCVANAVFKHDVLRIHVSDLNHPFAEHSFGIGATFYIGGMSVIITNDDDLLTNRFGHMLKLMNFMIRGR